MVFYSGPVEGRRPRRPRRPGRGLGLSEQRGLLGGDDVVKRVLADALRDALQPLVALLAAGRRHSGRRLGGLHFEIRIHF